MKEVILGLVILAYVIPFAYIFISDIYDIAKRLFIAFNAQVKPALVVLVKSVIKT